MLDGKYTKLLTVVLVIVVIGILILLGFLGYDVYKKFSTDREVSSMLNEYNKVVNENNNENTENIEVDIPLLNEDIIESNTSSGNKTVTYKGYEMVGKIEIPTISLEYPILNKATGTSIELAVAVQYGPGPNKVGNTVIVGHNYRNGAFFGNNDRLQIGDKIYITDNSGTKIKYNIYNIYETSPEDSDFYIRDTAGKREISLSTCTDNSKARLIIWAVEE